MANSGHRAVSRHDRFQTGSRATHSSGGFDPTATTDSGYGLYMDQEQIGAWQIPPGSVNDGTIDPGGLDGDGSLTPGSVTITPFADSVRPVVIATGGSAGGAFNILLETGDDILLETGDFLLSEETGAGDPADLLPELPSADYPEGATVFNLTDGKIYRNVADVWTRAVDGFDLIADTVTANAISAGAVGAVEISANAISADHIQAGAIGATEIAADAIDATHISADAIETEHLAATASISLVANADNSVVITPTGMTISGGALTLEDEFAQTVMEASGFSGSWGDFVRLGVYNARLRGAVGSLDLGRTSDMPYWYVDYDYAAVGISGGGVTFTFGANGDVGDLYSDLVPVRPGMTMEAGCAYKLARSSGTIRVVGYVYFYKADGTSAGAVTFAQLDHTASVSSLRWRRTGILVPDDASTAEVVVGAAETVGHHASNSVSFYAVELVDSPVNIPGGWAIGDDAVVNTASVSGIQDDYDPGSINTTTLYEMDLSGATTLRGLVAPNHDKRLVWLFNYSSYALTLANENVNSAAANRFHCPGGTNVVVAAGGAALIYYWTTASRWYVLDKT